jgi:PAS domain S-box
MVEPVREKSKRVFAGEGEVKGRKEEKETVNCEALLEAIPDLQIFVDMNRIVTYLDSKRVMNLAGYSKKELLDRKVEEIPLFTAKSLRVFDDTMKKLEKGEETYAVSMELVKKDGSAFTTSLALTNVVVNNKVIGYMITIRDITELKKAQEYSANLIKNAPNPVSVMTPDGKRIDTNLATEKLFKRSREEIIGTKGEKLYVKEDLTKIRNALEESKKTGFSTCEATCIRGDKTTFPCVLNFSPVKDEEGSIIRVLITATDITEVKEAQAFTQALVRKVPIPMSIMDASGKRTDVNEAFEKFYMHTKEEAVGLLVEKYIAKRMCLL